MRSEMNFVTAEQLAEIMGISKGHAYKIIHVLNEELQTKGFPDSIRKSAPQHIWKNDAMESRR